MGKKRRAGFKKPKHGIDNLANAASSDDEEMEGRLESILDDEIDKYNAATENSLRKESKSQKRQRQDSDNEEEHEVFGLDVSSEDEEKDADNLDGLSDSDEDESSNDEDILGDETQHDGIPDSRAWGKKARAYFNTDYVDQDFGGFEGSDAEMAEQEEAEAKEIQKRLTAELDESDFTDFLPPAIDKSKKVKDGKTKEILKIDIDNLSPSEKLKLVHRECPEVVHLLEELKSNLKVAKELKKSMECCTDHEMNDFYQAKYHTILNYCVNISYYLHLRSTKPANCKGHPVIKRILQFRRLLDEVNQFKPRIPLTTQSSLPPKAKKPKKELKIPVDDDAARRFEEQLKAIANPKPSATEEGNPNVEESDELAKRGITYEMSKNKGLAPVRKKEQRNPRVKHRIKYQKAKVRRKGQVRTPRTETTKYDGESYGIKSHVTKSIKLK